MKKIRRFNRETIGFEDEDFVFTVRGLTRAEYKDYLKRIGEITKLPDEEKLDAQIALEDELIDLCVEPEEAKDVLKNSGSSVVQFVIREILALSGLSEEERKNLE